MKRVLASYRWRRRLIWMTVTAGVVGSALAIGFIWPNTAPPENTKPTGGPVKIAAPPKKVPLKVRERAAALAVASRFIDTAVARKNVDRAWGLVTPTLHAGYTRKQWDTANLPGIPPFPVAEARWRLQFSDAKGIGFTMALFPTKASHQQAQVFMIGLHKVGAGTHRHWLVDNWQAAPTTASQVASGGGGATGGVFDQISPRVSATSAKAKESPIWLLIPVGLLSLALLIPAVIAGTNWYRDRRARALFGE
ncbi:MAG: hypothetical protein E6G23_00185 [Actinobacteria bacterium]|nr:MAG: hypothetical protein E6G23_00185 [Actinomycetota bacterium]